jgi:hypothetical protein
VPDDGPRPIEGRDAGAGDGRAVLVAQRAGQELVGGRRRREGKPGRCRDDLQEAFTRTRYDHGMRGLGRWAIAVALALAACAGAAAGTELLAGDPALLVSSARPALLGPITEFGRTGWDCDAERAATARTATAAGLPRE